MEKIMRMRFEDASISNLSELNESFATGRLKVMYTGGNRNGSEFSQEVVEAALPSLKNIPIVANYSTDTNEIGGHDAEVVRDGDSLRLRNLTEPCGVVPESAAAYFSEEEDTDGVRHNYLVVEPVILWKRQEVFRHISNDLDGKVGHSMEVSISAFHKSEGSDLLTVDAFRFEALCLLESAMPCFEGSELEVFSTDVFRERMEEMMAELKEAFTMLNPPETEIENKSDLTEKGGRVLDEKLELVKEFGLDAESLEFSLDDFSLEELREKFESMKEPEAAPAAEEPEENFELNQNIRKAVSDALYAEKIQRPWGEECAYWLEDYDLDAGLVYAQCTQSWNFFAIPFHMDGDAAVLMFENAKRVKPAFVDYVEGGEEERAGMFAQAEEKFAAISQELEALKESTADYEELKKFREDAEAAEAAARRSEVFDKFTDLAGNEAFEALRENAEAYDLEALEEKCYAIRGRAGVQAKFSAPEARAPKIIVPQAKEAADEPYGGLIPHYGIG